MKIFLNNSEIVECDKENFTIFQNSVELKSTHQGHSIEKLQDEVRITDIEGKSVIIKLAEVDYQKTMNN